MRDHNPFFVVLGASTALFLLASPALAQQSFDTNITNPTYYRVSNVASNDVLNIRQSALSSSAEVGALAFDAFPVEVMQVKDGWGYISTQESSGWVSLRFLEQISFSKFGETNLPDGLTCGGTEPFWGLALANGEVIYSAIDTPGKTYSLFQSGQMQNLGGSTSYLIAQSDGVPLTGIVSDQFCSDGMSDKDFARRIDLLLSDASGTVGLSGCCSIQTN